MKMCRLGPRTFLSQVTVFLLVYLSLAGHPAAMCPLKTLSVNKVQGRITEIDTRKGFPDPPLAHTKVVLKRLGDEEDILVGEAETDATGFFEIAAVPKGTYRLVVYFIVDGRDITAPYHVILKVKKSKAKKSRKYIHVSMSYSCFDTTAETVRRTL